MTNNLQDILKILYMLDNITKEQLDAAIAAADKYYDELKNTEEGEE